jgi:hypothetical protein
MCLAQKDDEEILQQNSFMPVKPFPTARGALKGCDGL